MKYHLRENDGVSLIELLIAVVFVIICVVVTSMLFPRSIRSTVEGNVRAQASDLAQSKIQEIKSIPYDLLVDEYTAGTPPTGGLTPASEWSFVGGPFTQGCNCSTRDLNDPVTQPAPFSDTVTIGNVTFTRQVCLNISVRNTTTNTWEAYCPVWYTQPANLNRQPNVNIRVRVSWPTANQRKAIEVESMISRI